MSSRLRRLIEKMQSLFSLLTSWRASPEEKLSIHALSLYKKYASTIQSILGSPDIPNIEIRVSNELQVPASTSGTTVALNFQYFDEHKDDGAMIHEFVHAVHRCPRYDSDTAWLIEGIADYIRDVLNFQNTASYPHFEKDKALLGYQTTAHFLFWLEKKNPGSITLLSKHLINNTYSKNVFYDVFSIALDGLVSDYEKIQGIDNG